MQKIGKSEQDLARRESEANLKTDAEHFAQIQGWHEQFLEEQAFMPDYLGNQNEWTRIVNATQPPSYNADCVPLNATHHTSPSGSGSSNWLRCGWLRPSESERHIGIDQGVKNFATVAVDKMWLSMGNCTISSKKV